MLKRNKMLIAFMLVAVLCVSVGFATLTDTLKATGNLTLNVPEEGEVVDPSDPIVKNFDEDVYFSDVKTPTVSTNATVEGLTASVDESDNDEISITIPDGTFTDATQYVTVIATIKNDATYSVDVSAAVSSHDYFTVTGTFAETATTATIEANGTATLTIVVTLKAVPPASIAAEQFTVKVTATPTNLDTSAA